MRKLPKFLLKCSTLKHHCTLRASILVLSCSLFSIVTKNRGGGLETLRMKAIVENIGTG